MYGRLATAMTTDVSRRLSAPYGDDGDNESMWSLELASSWARLDAACGYHGLTETEPIITKALARLPSTPSDGFTIYSASTVSNHLPLTNNSFANISNPTNPSNTTPCPTLPNPPREGKTPLHLRRGWLKETPRAKICILSPRWHVRK
jgi:hypothetical protein